MGKSKVHVFLIERKYVVTQKSIRDVEKEAHNREGKYRDVERSTDEGEKYNSFVKKGNTRHARKYRREMKYKHAEESMGFVKKCKR